MVTVNFVIIVVTVCGDASDCGDSGECGDNGVCSDNGDCWCADSQEKIRTLKKNLQSCKSLLRCKREELKRLWLEDVRFKHMLKLIDTM